jgi:hypothetical protein
MLINCTSVMPSGARRLRNGPVRCTRKEPQSAPLAVLWRGFQHSHNGCNSKQRCASIFVRLLYNRYNYLRQLRVMLDSCNLETAVQGKKTAIVGQRHLELTLTEIALENNRVVKAMRACVHCRFPSVLLKKLLPSLSGTGNRAFTL